MSILRVLYVEDQERHVASIARHLSRGGYDLVSERVDTAPAMRLALETRDWDVILCEHSMPNFSAEAALALTKEMNLDLPFIIISGTVGEAIAVEAMRSGAHDYLMKGSLARLVPVIQRELSEFQNRLARRKVEEECRLQGAALQAAANAILITERTGKIIWVNPAFTETTGYSFEDVRGKNPRLLKSDKHDATFYREMWTTIISGRVWHNPIINRRKDGTLNREDLTITPIRNAAGEITHFVGIKQDITQLAQALSEVQNKNQELATMTQQLWQASKLATMGELAASVAHELNNPLATLSLHAEALLDRLPDDDPSRQSIQVIEREIERMAKLVSNLLLFGRRGHQQVSTIAIDEELQNSLEFIHSHLRSNGITIATDFACNLPNVQADRQQLRQVFLNLATNASDAMAGGGTLTVRAKRENLESDGAAIVIEFSDTGVGIPPEDLPHLWEPFFTTKPEGKGTGLGLPICRRMLEAHRGSIDIESELGKGTTVRLVLPAMESGAIRA
jgi:PAS domain S-box-containing protein